MLFTFTSLLIIISIQSKNTTNLLTKGRIKGNLQTFFNTTITVPGFAYKI